MSDLPPCGLYRTTLALGEAVPSGRLVYFHNHGEPGPGVYLPEMWHLNRARWRAQGTMIPDQNWIATLQPLPPEGFYRVKEAFTCCSKNCRTFEPELLVQVGYNGAGDPLLFIPQWTPQGVAIPATGTPLDRDKLGGLSPLKVELSEEAARERH